MRMWMVDPEIMCSQHLLGEHCELHMFIGAMKKKISVKGYLESNCLEPEIIGDRHDELAKEIERRKPLIQRNDAHKSPLLNVTQTISYLNEDDRKHKIDKELSLSTLLSRCPRCKLRYEQKHANK